MKNYNPEQHRADKNQGPEIEQANVPQNLKGWECNTRMWTPCHWQFSSGVWQEHVLWTKFLGSHRHQSFSQQSSSLFSAAPQLCSFSTEGPPVCSGPLPAWECTAAAGVHILQLLPFLLWGLFCSASSSISSFCADLWAGAPKDMQLNSLVGTTLRFSDEERAKPESLSWC